MVKYIKNINIISFVFILVLLLGTLEAEQFDLQRNESKLQPELEATEPDVLQETYLRGNREEKGQQCSSEVASPLGEECSYCHNDEATVFTEKGEKTKEMMKASVAIGVRCDYCHAGKEQFTEKKEISDKMFELSEMMGTECKYCHAGKDILTLEGKTAKTAMILQEWAKNGNKKCLECHVEKKQFELNFHGWEVLNTQKGLLGL
ncbi:MAG: hypothetical protein ACE5KZ_11370 [Candidatus Scalinduaceae bacterium]